MIDALTNRPLLEVDGGVNLKNIKSISSAGADVFVAGATVFGSGDYDRTIADLKESING
jgi:ribulose-phosphate 3-epimerase